MRFPRKMGDATLVDSMLTDGLIDAFNNYHMGITGELHDIVIIKPSMGRVTCILACCFSRYRYLLDVLVINRVKFSVWGVLDSFLILS